MTPANELKLLEVILRTNSNPPKLRSPRLILIGAALWLVSGFAVLTIVGGSSGLTWQVLAVAGIGFTLGLFSYYDWYRNVRAMSWPVFSPYFDIAAIERRIAELRT